MQAMARFSRAVNVTGFKTPLLGGGVSCAASRFFWGIGQT